MLPTSSSQRHDGVTIALHWLTAFLAATVWIIGQTMDIAPNGPLRVDYRSLHMLLGVAVGLLFLGRLIWRLTGARAPQPIEQGVLGAFAKATHWVLYLLLAAAVGLGAFNAWVRGDQFFGLFHFTSWAPGDRAMHRLIGGWHALAANALLIIGGLHSAAALFHHFVLRDPTLRRMLPG